ncbi:MAG: toxin-antitoxin system HicB family antitoxin [Planctomycetota bacterium]|nr:MAG: toxin-antitoxin system HicB family antitoxin [Planctomycetota bacterium]
MPPEPPESQDPGGSEPAAGGDERARKSFVLRLSPDLHAELRRWAAADLRSLNAQVEWILRDAVRRRRG